MVTLDEPSWAGREEEETLGHRWDYRSHSAYSPTICQIHTSLCRTVASVHPGPNTIACHDHSTRFITSLPRQHHSAVLCVSSEVWCVQKRIRAKCETVRLHCVKIVFIRCSETLTKCPGNRKKSCKQRQNFWVAEGKKTTFVCRPGPYPLPEISPGVFLSFTLVFQELSFGEKRVNTHIYYRFPWGEFVISSCISTGLPVEREQGQGFLSRRLLEDSRRPALSMVIHISQK